MFGIFRRVTELERKVAQMTTAVDLLEANVAILENVATQLLREYKRLRDADDPRVQAVAEKLAAIANLVQGELPPAQQ